MQQRPSWKIYSLSTRHKIPYIWWNPKFHHHIQNTTPLVSILTQINSVNTLPSCFAMLHRRIELPSTLRSSKQFLSFRCSYHKHCYFLSLPCAPHNPPISSCFSMLHLHIFLPSAPVRSSKWSPASDVPTKTIYISLTSHMHHMLHLPYPP